MKKVKPIKIAVASGKGGTGKTLISTNLFYALSKQGHNVTLIDCDAEEPNTMVFFSGDAIKSTDVTQWVPVIDESKCTYCGKCHDWCSYKAIFIIPPSKVIKVMDDLCHGCGACTVACEFGAITEKEVSLGEIQTYKISPNAHIVENRMHVGVYSPVSIIKKGIKEVNNNQIVLMDSPPGTSCSFIQTVSKADYTILITEPTPFGISDLQQSASILEDLGIPHGVIVNRSGLGNSEIYQFLDQKNIPLLMEIPFDRAIAESYSKGEIVSKTNPELEKNLVEMFKTINNEYGNSSN